MLIYFCVLLSLQWVAWIDVASGQYLPPIACPSYFQYVNDRGQNVGRLTLPIGAGLTRLTVRFTQRTPLRSNYVGAITLFQDLQTTISYIQRGLPVAYRVAFPTANELPKLTQIVLNGNTICSASGYAGRHTKITLEHNMQTSGVSPLSSNYGPTVQAVQPAQAIVARPQTRPQRTRAPASRPARPAQTGVPQNRAPTQQTRAPTQQTRASSPQTRAPQPQTRPPQSQVPQTQFPQFQSPPTQSSAPPNSDPAPSAQSVVSTPLPTAPPLRPTEVPTPMTQNLSAVCGREGEEIGFSPLIYQGNIITRGQYPWMTPIYKKQSAGLNFICGGSLLSTRTVVTAGHCFKLHDLTASQVVVYFGRYDLGSYAEEGWIVREPETLIVHPDYKTAMFSDADIALLQFSSPVGFTRYIQPICLWTEPTDVNLIVGQSAIIAGWGANDKGTMSLLPKSVGAKIVSEGDCLRSSTVFKELTSPRTLCAGNRDGSGPCHGDSGSGLMLKNGGRWMLRGVVSAGQTKANQCNLDEYVVYCDVAKHINWVQANILA